MSDPKTHGLLKWLLAVAIAGLLLAVVNAASIYRQKTDIEKRVEALESGRREQQSRNEGQDRLNDIIVDGLEWLKRVREDPDGRK